MNKFLLIFLLIGISTPQNFAQNNAIRLNGISDYVEMSDNSQIDFFDQLTIEAWIKPETEMNVEDQVIVGKEWCSNSDFAYYLGVFNSKLKFTWNITGNCNFYSSYETDDQYIFAGQCYHVAIVFNSTGIKMYIDGTLVNGTLVDGSFGSIHNSSEPLRVGCYRVFSGSMSHFFFGEIDEVRMWNYELSEAEINARMNYALSGSESGLVAYFDMNSSGSGSGITVLNSASNTGASLDGVTYGGGTSPIFVPSCFQDLGVETQDSFSQISVYPNPGQGVFHVQNVSATTESVLDIKVFDALGKEIRSLQINSEELDLSDLNSGVYFLEIANTVTVTTVKLIIE